MSDTESELDSPESELDSPESPDTPDTPTYNEILKGEELQLDVHLFKGLEIIIPNMNIYPKSKSLYLDMDIFLNYLDTLIIQQNNSIEPLTQVCNMFSNNLFEYWIIIDVYKEFNFKIPLHLYSNLQECINNIYTRFIIIPIKIDLYKISHMNCLIIDKLMGTIEYFEPHGINMYGTYLSIYKIINQIIKVLKLNYNLININRNCKISVQTKQGTIDQKVGHCVAWNLLLMHLRLLNIYISAEILNTYLTTLSSLELDTYIKKYISYIELQPILPKLINQDIIYSKISLNLDNQDIELLRIQFKELIKKMMDNLRNNNNVKENIEEIINYKRFDFFPYDLVDSIKLY